jgi:hypothetical protein
MVQWRRTYRLATRWNSTRSIIRGSISTFSLIFRPNDVIRVERIVLTWSTNMPVKFSAKCWVRHVTGSSMKILKWNIKKFVLNFLADFWMCQAFVIHGSHSSITIYYTKLPNTYLSEIAKFGAKYLQRSSLKQRVNLCHTKKFHLRNTTERVELFHLLSKLLWYLISGKSHVGHLFNYDDSPLHSLVWSSVWRNWL